MEVRPGTHYEALVIGKDITVKGTAGETVIAGPESYDALPCIESEESGNSYAMMALVYIKSGNVTMEGISVTGDIQNFYDAFYGTLSGYSPVGIAVCNASLTAKDVDVRNIGIAESDNANYFGVQAGIAVLASATEDNGYAVSFDGGTVEGFQKGGFVIRDKISSFTLKNAEIRGCGATNLIAQNAIQIACDSVIEENTIANIGYTIEGTDAAGILTVDMAANDKTLNGTAVVDGENQTLVEVIESSNTFSNVQVNVSFYESV